MILPELHLTSSQHPVAMRSSILWFLATFAATSVEGHSIFQRLKVNDVDQGQLVGVRAPSSNNPVLSVTGSSIVCNTGLKTPVSTTVVSIPAGAKVSAWYQHILGGPQGANDADNPIAVSHKGPLIVYLAKVKYYELRLYITLYSPLLRDTGMHRHRLKCEG